MVSITETHLLLPLGQPGPGNQEIARTPYLSLHTVKDHIKVILNKTGVSSRGQLIAALNARH
jgi:DNA-binding NarL/FixJ family response regulator